MFLVLDFGLAGRFPPLGIPSRPPGTEPSLGRLSPPVPPPLAPLGGGAGGQGAVGTCRYQPPVGARWLLGDRNTAPQTAKAFLPSPREVESPLPDLAESTLPPAPFFFELCRGS